MNASAWHSRSILPAVAWTLVACTDAAPARPDAVYQVRGEVIALDGDGEDARVTVAHEAIADFKDRSGTPGGMPAMKMAFGIAPGVDASAFVLGSKWMLTFEVVWRREPALRIVRAVRLPPETVLEVPP